ncbi:MAG: hypothetical protein ACOYKZ_03435 [Chlamydiia bacterium]
MAVRPWIKGIVLSCIAVLGCSVLVSVLIGLGGPWFLSTNMGRDWLVGWINGRIPGTVELRKLRLSWSGPCEVQGLVIRDAQNQEIVNVDRMKLGDGLLGRLQHRPLTQASLTGGVLHLDLDRRGISNLERALGLVDPIECRSPRANRGQHPFDIDHLEFDLRSRGGIPELISSALCHHAGVEGGWRINARFIEEGPFPSDFDIEANKIPGELLEICSNVWKPSLRGIPTLILGDTIDITGTGRYQEVLQGQLTVSTPLLNGTWVLSGPIHHPRLALTHAATWSLDPLSCTQLLRRSFSTTTLQPKTACLLHITEASYELGSHGQFHCELTAPFELSSGEHTLSLQQFECESLAMDSQLSLSLSLEGISELAPLQAGLHVQSVPRRGRLSATGVPMWLLRSLAPQRAAATAWLGDTLALDGSYSPEAEHIWDLRATFDGTQPSIPGLPLVMELKGSPRHSGTHWEARASSPRMDLQSEGSFQWGRTLEAHRTQMVAQINQDLLRAVGFQPPKVLGLQTVPLQADINPVTLDLCNGVLGDLQLSFDAAPCRLELPEQSLLIDDLHGKGRWSPSQGSASLQLHASLVTQGQKPAPLGISGTIQDLHGRPSYEARIDCPALPVKAANALFQPLEGVETILGPTLAIQGELTAQQGGLQGAVDLQVQAPGLEGHIPLSWGNQWELTNGKEANITLRLTPQSVSTLRRWIPLPERLQLDSLLQAKFTCTTLKWPREGSGAPEVQAQLTLAPFSVSRSDHPGRLAVREGTWVLQRIGADGPLSTTGKLHVQLGSLDGTASVNATGRPHDLWHTLILEGRLDHFPVAALTMFLSENSELLADVCGEQADALFQLEPLANADALAWALTVDSPYLQSAASGSCMADGQFRLSKPWLTTWTISPEISDLHAKKFSNLIKSFPPNQMVASWIHPQGFYGRWKPPYMHSVVIPKGMLDLGQIQLTSTELVRGMLDFLKAQKTSKTMELWATPLYFSIDDGSLTLQRVDARIDRSTEICLWGGLNLDLGALSMQIGFPAGALAALALATLPEGGLMTVGLQGTLADPKVDWSAAAAKLAIAGASKFSLGGMLLSTAIDTMVSGSIPSPTTTPFPWTVPNPSSPKAEISKQLKALLKEAHVSFDHKESLASSASSL